MTHDEARKVKEIYPEMERLQYQINELLAIFVNGQEEAKDPDNGVIELSLKWEMFPGLREQINESILRHIESYLEDSQRRFEAL